MLHARSFVHAMAFFGLVFFTEGSFASAQKSKLITIASYNVENLWDANPNNTKDVWERFLRRLPDEDREEYPRQLQYNDYDPAYSNWYDPVILRTKTQHVVAAIEAMGTPDILAIQEVESAGNRSEVFDIPYDARLSFGEKLKQMGYEYQVVGPQEEDNPVAVTTAVLSKIPLVGLPSVKIQFSPRESTSARDVQVVEAKLGGTRLVLFNGHWKSKRGGGERQRIETARLVGQRVAKERADDPASDVVVLGDLNAAYFEEPLRTLGSTGDEGKMLGKPTALLYNLWYELPADERWETTFDGQRGTLSQFLISDSLFDHKGLQYVEGSFHVVGHEGAAAKLLLGVNGAPYRWQTRPDRGSGVTHSGKGYSDHLPLVASFRVIDEDGHKLVLKNPHSERPDDTDRFMFDKVQLCDEDKATDLASVSSKELETLEGACVKIELAASSNGLVLKTRGRYHSTYVDLPQSSLTSNRRKPVQIGLTMTRSFDWRPNIDDSRVTLAEASIQPGEYNSKRFHPHSNKCFLRKVLQGEGGKLRKVVGRLGYTDGYLSVHVASREERFLILESLPEKKLSSCPW